MIKIGKYLLVFCYLVVLLFLGFWISFKTLYWSIDGWPLPDFEKGVCGNHWGGVPFAFQYMFKNIPKGMVRIQCVSKFYELPFYLDVGFWLTVFSVSSYFLWNFLWSRLKAKK